MREIKFRAYSYRSKRMWGWGELENEEIGDMLKNPQEEIMQYTGLKDKNGKEIYEGDIVKIKYRDYLGIIKWRDCGFYINERDYAKKDFVLNITSTEEIIGNIYESPELLTEKA